MVGVLVLGRVVIPVAVLLIAALVFVLLGVGVGFLLGPESAESWYPLYWILGACGGLLVVLVLVGVVSWSVNAVRTATYKENR